MSCHLGPSDAASSGHTAATSPALLRTQGTPGDGEPVGVEAGGVGRARDQGRDQLGLPGGEIGRRIGSACTDAEVVSQTQDSPYRTRNSRAGRATRGRAAAPGRGCAGGRR